ncbi:MAG: hypothetical protein APR63_07460 [Desulfuromonas sp. SDB]|nr:MAG: hypothetical protein APR63_07460 [Desulfuromonas sp. SDB]
MNICHITHNYPRFPGDHAGFFIEDLTKGLAGHLSAGKNKISVITPHQQGLPTCQNYCGIDIHRVKYARHENIAYTGKMHHFLMNPVYWNQFIGLFEKTYLKIKEIADQFDILHFHWIVPSGIIGYFIQHPCKIISIHGTDLRIMEKYPFNLLMKKILIRYNTVIPVSTYLKKILEAHTDKLNIEVLPIIGNLDNFISSPSSQISQPLQLITVSRLSKQKNLSVVLQAVKLLHDSGVQVNYTIAGDGEYKNNLIEQTNKLGISDLVKFTGMISHNLIPELLKGFDIFVLPSLNEGFGLSVLEARLSGKLVIGSNSGGLLDLIKDHSTGIFFNPRDPSRLAELIKSVISSNSKYINITTNSFNEAKKKYSYTNQVKQWLEIYSRILHNPDF